MLPQDVFAQPRHTGHAQPTSKLTKAFWPHEDMCGKGIDIGMEILVEGNAIKARSIRADSREFQFFVRRTRSQERDVNSICCKMKIRFRRQSVFDPKTTTSGIVFRCKPRVRAP